MKGGFMNELTDAAADLCIERIAAAPPGEFSIGLWTQGGAISNVPEDSTAFMGRDAAFWFDIEAFWLEPARDAASIAWARSASAALKPFRTAGRYVNDAVESGDDVVRSIYGDAKYDRLRALKRTYDPDNVFRLNQNIRP
jgi:hypothetical protein